LGGRARNTVERSRVTGKKGRRGGGDDGNLRLAGVGGGGATHAGLRGAGGHSVRGWSLLSSDVGVVGSSAGAVDGEEERASTPAAAVLIGGSAGRTSPAVELMGSRWPGQEGDALSAREEEERRVKRKGGEECVMGPSRQSRHRCYK
jgi:hypothetical protein